MRERWIGDRLHLLSWGPEAGATVLLLHGITESAGDWIPFAEYAENAGVGLHLVALDLRGHGASAHHDREAYDHLDHYADLLSVIGELEGPVDVVGHSLSGHVCLFLAALSPDLVRSLVLVDVEAFPPRRQADELRRFGARPHDVFESFETALEKMRLRLPGVDEAILRNKVRRDMIELENGRFVARFDRAALRRLSSPDAEPFLPLIQCPMLLVRGELSEVMRLGAAQEMERAISDARLVEIPNASHSPHLENPIAFSEAVLGFLAELHDSSRP
jgi:pimeloyl-ACP methyl ester carboxylesterase